MILSSILYVDDTTFIFKHTSFDSFINDCNQELLKFKNWTLANKLSQNLDKTYVMIFTFSDTTVMNPQTLIDDNLLEIKITRVFLGVCVDVELKIHLHTL